MLKHTKTLILLLKNFLSLENIGVFVDKNLNIENFPRINSKKFLRFYVAISHSLLRFEALKVPATLPPKKRSSAAKLEAKRFFNLIGEAPEALSFSLFLSPREEVFVAALPKKELSQALNPLLPRGLICGVFPAWVALFAYLKKRPSPPQEGLFFVKSEEAYEGFWLEEGYPRGLLPSSPQAAEKFISFFAGPVEEIPGSPQEVLAKGAYLVPEVFAPEEVPTFEDYPLLLRPKVSPKVFLFWLLPLLIWAGGFGLAEQNKRLAFHLSQTQKKLTTLQQKYQELEEKLKKAKLEEELKAALKPYLPGQRPPLLKALLELTLAFPEDAWVRRFEFRAPDKIRLWGEANNALSLLEALSKNPLFAEAKFLSTVSKNPVTGRENFSIELTLASAKPQSKAAKP